MKQYLLIILCVFALSVFGQKKKFQINGAGRAYYLANELDIDRELDSISTRKANYGHTLLDFGISAFPNNNTEIIGMFRIRNELGGFWGAGVSFNVRQLTLKGVAGNIVRYELGDIDIRQTPYTVWNSPEEGNLNEGEVFSQRRRVVHYDMFYNDTTNAWRMQGAKAAFGLKFNKGIDAIRFKSYLTRQQVTDGLAVPERLFGGGSLGVVVIPRFELSFNSANLFDLKETIADSIQFKNSVHTAGFRYKTYLKDSIELGFSGEAGLSTSQYLFYQDLRAPESLSDWFVDVNIHSIIADNKFKLSLGYKDVGSDFRSPGAQTRRINFSQFPRVYQQYTNDAIGRPISYVDFISGNTDNTNKISESLVPYFAAYNNSTPYGQATPNRKGVYFNAEQLKGKAFKKSFLRFSGLTQSRGTGTTQKKLFLLAETGTDLYLNEVLNWERKIKFDLGLRYETTARSGESYEQINLQSVFGDVGMSIEIAKKLDLLFGAKLWSTSGTAFVNERNVYNTIVDFDIVNYDFEESVIAAGIQYRFNEHNVLSTHFQKFNISHASENLTDYGMSQFTILYNLFF